MSHIKIRALRADEVEVRAAKITKSGAQFLIYKDARVDKRILDETFGVFGWRNRYEVVNGNLYCTVDIWDEEKKEWISKCDCGTESNTEKEKGEASDAFKRACFNVGIGRELYTKIFIFIPGITKPDPKQAGKYVLNEPFLKYSVSEMEVDEEKEKITKLVIVDEDGLEAFRYPVNPSKKTSRTRKTDPPEPAVVLPPVIPEKGPDSHPTVPTLTKTQADVVLAAFEAQHGKCERGTPALDKLRKFVESFGVKKIGEIPASQYNEAILRIKTV